MPTQTAVDVLRFARVLLAAPAAWLHDPAADGAQDEAGHACLPYADVAVRWDVYGALVAPRSGDAALDAALGFVAEAAGLCPRITGPLSIEVFGLVREWHDDPARVHADVLRVLDAAFVLATAAEAA